MLRKPLLVFLSLAITLSAFAAAASRMTEFKIAGGQTVKCPITDEGMLPAESGPYKMEVAAIMLGKVEDQNITFITFTFGIDVSRKGKPTRIVVLDVSGEKEITLVDDPSPKIEKKYWKGDAKPLVVDENSTPWIFEKKPTTKVFKIIISAKDTADVIMYQPALYSVDFKRQIAMMAR